MALPPMYPGSRARVHASSCGHPLTVTPLVDPGHISAGIAVPCDLEEVEQVATAKQLPLL